MSNKSKLQRALKQHRADWSEHQSRCLSLQYGHSPRNFYTSFSRISSSTTDSITPKTILKHHIVHSPAYLMSVKYPITGDPSHWPVPGYGPLFNRTAPLQLIFDAWFYHGPSNVGWTYPLGVHVEMNSSLSIPTLSSA